MRVDNLRWHPVRISAKRVRSGVWWISRDDTIVGEVEFQNGLWMAVQGRTRQLEDGREALIWNKFSQRKFQSFRAAVLSVTRFSVTAHAGEVQDLGTVRMLRVNVASSWYTVLLQGAGPYIYQDFGMCLRADSEGPTTDHEQAILRKVLTEVDRWGSP